jgi:sec-independent protein translocase protein TatA
MTIVHSLALIPQGAELWILLGILVLFFGGAKIPQLMRGIGKGVGELQEGLKEGKKKMDEAIKDVKDETSTTSSSDDNASTAG